MRISMVSEHASPLAALGGVDAGGQNVHVAALSSALARLGHTVTVYTRRDDPGLAERVDAAPGVEVVHVTAGPARHIPKDELLPYMPELGAGIARDWAGVRPDVVHAHFWMSGLAALDAVRATDADIPVLQTFHALGTVKRRHQGADDTSPNERAWLEPWVGRNVDGVIATCSDEVFELRAMGVDARSISVAPCGVDSALFRPDGPAEERGNRARIAVVGRLVPRKGVDIAIRALAALKHAGRTDVELVIVGGSGGASDPAADPEARRMIRLADELDVADQVVVRGQVPQADLPRILRSANAVVCVPWYEPFGIVPLEAMACGVPVIAASVGGLIDTVVDGVTGIHVPPRDPEAVAEAILQIVDDPARAAELGRMGRTRSRTRYTWNRVAQTTAKVYRGILAQADPVTDLTADGGAL
ncbi:glycosyltransferase [Cryobacterium tepidiphilum]|uniref:Glycosyltransferase family 1 protein n=1 Tax=Cryobacterium tepidiphilum TaxID=2486026 RepID=A0A3M8LAD2_9MICO|nr:glycosyltransferase [Cryobacterium tepidiphilum]RNE62406.1 glycosyltransferase family 1 protein [Cryobacterium tepidiphilum]